MTSRSRNRHEVFKGTRHVEPLQVLQRTVETLEDAASAALMAVEAFSLADLPDEDRGALEPRLVAALAQLERFKVEVTGGPATRHAIPCLSCSTRFDSRRSDATYCSQACRQAAYRRRKNHGQ